MKEFDWSLVGKSRTARSGAPAKWNESVLPAHLLPLKFGRNRAKTSRELGIVYVVASQDLPDEEDQQRREYGDA
jgi:hypothetical protein